MSQVYLEYSVILLGSLVVFLVSAYLMHKAIDAFNLSRVTIPAFWYLTYLIMIYFPSFIVFFRQTNPAKYAYLFAVESAMITIPLGILAINTLCRFKKVETSNFFTAPLQKGKPDIHITTVYATFLGIAIAFTILYMMSLDKIPLLYMLRHPDVSSYELAVLREESFKLFDPRWASPKSTSFFYIYLFLRTMIYPFLIMVSLGYYLLSRKKSWLFLFLATLIFGVLYAAASIARAPVAAIFLRVMFFIYIFKQGKFGKKTVISFLILILFFPLFITKGAYKSPLLVTKEAYKRNFEFLETPKKIAVRLCYAPAADLYDYFEIFPHHHDYIYGQTLAKPFLVLLRKEYFYIENYVYKYRFPLGLETGHSNAAFQSNLHADFGVWGVLVGGFSVGMLMQGIHIYLLRKRKTVITMAIYSFMVYAFWVLNSGSVTSVLFVNGVIPVLFLAFIFKAMRSFLKYATMKNTVMILKK